MPLPMEMTEVSVKEEIYSMVVFEGICHIIVNSAPKAQEFVDELIEEQKESAL